VNEFELNFDWNAVQTSSNARCSFPEPIGKYIHNHYRQPAIYRWVIRHGRKTSVYIGETEKLDIRLSHYLKPCGSW